MKKSANLMQAVAVVTVLATFAAVSQSFTVQARAASVFEPYVGTFRGSGTVRRGPNDAAESVRCRIAAELSADGLSLHQTGTCAVPGSKAAIDSRIKFDPANGRLSGSWTDVANGARAGVTGTVSGDMVKLTIVGRDEKTGERRTFWLTLQPTASGYRMTSTSPDRQSGAKYTSGEIKFTK